MKGYTFHADLPSNRGSKQACKKHGAFTRATLTEWASRGLHCNVMAVFTGVEHRLHDGGQECLAAVFDTSNSDVNLCSVSRDHLRKRTVRIREDLARKLHPRLFERLDAA